MRKWNMPVLVPATNKNEALPLNGNLCKSGYLFPLTSSYWTNHQDIFGWLGIRNVFLMGEWQI